MKAFELIHPATLNEASRLLTVNGGSGDATQLMAGGQDLLGMMKDYLYTPAHVIDLKRISGLNSITFDPKAGLRIGALTTITQLADNADVQLHYPALADAAGSVGSVQIRNVGTVGGNLCQRPRCWYFRNENIHCLKKGGDTCYSAADDAQNKYHAIFGGGPCHIVHPSDLAPALLGLGASVNVTSHTTGNRTIPMAQFYLLPADGGLYQEHVLKPDEIVTSVSVPISAFAKKSIYLKFREKESFDWSLVSVAMAADTEGGVVRDSRIVFGGVAQIPWRVPHAEAALKGHALSDQAAVANAAKLAVAGAVPLAQNAYKVTLAQTLIKRAAMALASGATSQSQAKGSEEWTI
jgi:xanthine dehydrogenase YagS FAD-binding subunit